MTDVNELVDWLRAQLDAEDALAHRLLERHVINNPGSPRHGMPAWPTPRVIATYQSYSDPVLAEGLVLVEAFSPTRVLAEIQAKRAIIDTVMSWRHVIVEDCWYTCAAATEERDGEVSCRDDVEPGDPCTCGLDRKRLAILGPLALPLADRAGYRPEWAP